jgi:hypothetical protein
MCCVTFRRSESTDKNVSDLALVKSRQRQALTQSSVRLLPYARVRLESFLSVDSELCCVRM